MEEYDDLSKGPNKDGEINLSYGAWKEMPHELYDKFRSQLVKLSISHNQLSSVSHHVGYLTLLKELDLSHNKIRCIDGSIGKCVRLRKLNLSYNNIKTIPIELCSCTMLDTLQLNDNRLTSLPAEFYFPALETLDLRNNDLISLPLQLCSIESLKEINCSENFNLSMVPTAIQSDSELVLWALRLQLKFKTTIDNNIHDYNRIEETAKQFEVEKLELMREMDALEEVVDQYKRNRPLQYIELKAKVQHFFHVLKEQIDVRKYLVKKSVTRILPIGGVN